MDDLEGHRNCHYSIGSISLPITICSDNISFLHRFRDITTLAMLLTAGNLKKSFSFNKTVEITSQVRSPIHM